MNELIEVYLDAGRKLTFKSFSCLVSWQNLGVNVPTYFRPSVKDLSRLSRIRLPTSIVESQPSCRPQGYLI